MERERVNGNKLNWIWERGKGKTKRKRMYRRGDGDYGVE
jgi:hypothetical protein